MGIVFVDHSCMMFLSRINMYIENKCCDFHFNVSVVCLLNVLFWSPNENKLAHCGLFVRVSVKEIKREIFEILTVWCVNCFLSVKSIAFGGALAKVCFRLRRFVIFHHVFGLAKIRQ